MIATTSQHSKTVLFYGLMFGASALAVAKIAILALVLPAADFALYVSVFALVSFAAEMTSFGLTQSTVKRFPRLVAVGHFNVIASELRAIIGTLSVRHGLVALTGAAIGGWLYGQSGVLAAMGIGLFAYGMNLFALTSSLFRGLNRLVTLGTTSIVRAFSGLCVCIVLAVWQGWQTALLGEAVAVVAFGAALVFYFMRVLLRNADTQAASSETVINQGLAASPYDGMILFVAYMVLIVPVSLDRSFITRLDAIDVAKTYAFISIWLTAAATVAAIYVQKFGPDMVKALTLNPEIRPLSRTRRNAALLAFMLLLATLLSFGVLNLIFFEAYWQKYNLTWLVVVMAAMAVCVQVTPLFDWTLIALDGERQLLMAACINLGLVVAGFGLCLWTGSGYPGYAAALVVGRIGQIAWSDHAINLLQTRNRLRMTGTFE